LNEIYGSAEEIRAKITSKLLLQAIDYWESIAEDDVIPRRSAIDPMAIPKLLPTTLIVEAEDDGGFRYQLAGTAVEERYKLGTLRGKTPEEVVGDAAEKVLVPYRRVRDEAVLFYRESTLEWVSAPQKYTHYMVLLLPLSDDGKNVNMILGIQDFIRAPSVD
tara:strand:+ start:15694 stop:16179 length:486 start_codon:yes stop_codon:yes gene_type:complete